MAKERLSTIQKYILAVFKSEETEILPYRKLLELTFELQYQHKDNIPDDLKKLHSSLVAAGIKPTYKNYQPSFSRSLRNLLKKGYVRLLRKKIYTDWDGNYKLHKDSRVVGNILLTAKGKELLNVNKSLNNKEGKKVK